MKKGLVLMYNRTVLENDIEKKIYNPIQIEIFIGYEGIEYNKFSVSTQEISINLWKDFDFDINTKINLTGIEGSFLYRDESNKYYSYNTNNKQIIYLKDNFIVENQIKDLLFKNFIYS